MPKVVVTDATFESLDIERNVLEPRGCRVVSGQCRTALEVEKLVRDADFVLTQFAPINGDVIRLMEKAKVIVRYGIGVDNVDLEAARERGIPVCNVPDYCIDEVADHTLAFILAATRCLIENDSVVRRGEWKLAVPLDRMKTLKNLTVGVVGFGRIGREVCARLKSFKPRILVHDPFVTAEEMTRLGYESTDRTGLCSESDILSLHCPSTAETRRWIDRKTLEQMKPGVILVNLARGNLVDTEALVDALKSGKVSAAALDVFDPEPPPQDSLLLSMENVVLASHVASASPEAVRVLRETAASIVVKAFQGEPLPNVVNGVGTG